MFRQLQIVTTILTALTAVAALILSLITTIQLNRRADMSLTMPNILRIAQGSGVDGTNVWIQPTFTVYQKTDISSVVKTLRLNITPSQANQVPPYFYWVEVDEFVYNTQTGEADYKYLSDPAPIVVIQDKPQVPQLLFATNPALFRAGRWKGVLTAERLGQSPLSKEFCIDISEDNVTMFSKMGIERLAIFRNDTMTPSPLATPSNCYRH